MDFLQASTSHPTYSLFGAHSMEASRGRRSSTQNSRLLGEPRHQTPREGLDHKGSLSLPGKIIIGSVFNPK
jgi:hypothetical protein